MSHKTPDYRTPDFTMICPTCWGSGEISFEDERYGKGFGKFESAVPCACRFVAEPVEYAVREVRQRLEALVPEAELYLTTRPDFEASVQELFKDRKP